MLHFARFKRAWLFVALFGLVVGIGQVSAQQGGLSQVIAPTDRAISIHVPAGWQFQTMTNQIYSSLLVFGDSGATMQAITAAINSNGNPTGLQGSYGVVGIMNPSLYGSLPVAQVAQNWFQTITSSQAGITVVAEQNQSFGGGLYTGYLALFNATSGNITGYTAVFTDGNSVMVAILGIAPGANFPNVQGQFGDMLQSIRSPAEANAITTPSQGVLTPLAPQASPTADLGIAPVGTTVPPQVGAPGATTLVRASDGSFSLELPSNWVVEDHLADLKVFAYGNSSAAAQSRLASVTPNAASARSREAVGWSGCSRPPISV